MLAICVNCVYACTYTSVALDERIATEINLDILKVSQFESAGM